MKYLENNSKLDETAWILNQVQDDRVGFCIAVGLAERTQ